MAWNGRTVSTTTASVSFDRDVFDLAEERRLELGMTRSRFVSAAIEEKLKLRLHPELYVTSGRTPKGWLERATHTQKKKKNSITQSISFDEELFAAMERRREELRMTRAEFVSAVLESLLGILEHPELDLSTRKTRQTA